LDAFEVSRTAIADRGGCDGERHVLGATYAGTTNDFPTTAGAFDRTFNGGADEYAYGTAVDTTGNACVTRCRWPTIHVPPCSP